VKALQVVRPNQLAAIEKAMPAIEREDDVLVKIRCVGICGSDMHIYHGESPVATYPRVLGHEVVGEVVETGAAVEGLRPGDKVVVEPIVTCGSCYACLSGRHNVCVNLEVYGVHRDGGFQEYLALPRRCVHKVDDRLSWEEAVLIEPFTIGAQAVSRGDVREGDIVFIMGAGPIGLCTLQVAKLRGAFCIISDLSDEKLEYAVSLGADATINPLRADVREEVLAITEGYGPNVTIDAVCTVQTFEQAVELTSAAGRVVVLGFGPEPSRIAQLAITRKELTIAGSRLQTNKFPEVIEWFGNGKIKPQSFVTHRFPFERAAEAIGLIETHPQDVRKVILEFS